MNTQHQLKSKINMKLVFKEYEIKTKIKSEAGTMTTAKNAVLLGYSLTIVIPWGGLTFGGGGWNKNLVLGE